MYEVDVDIQIMRDKRAAAVGAAKEIVSGAIAEGRGLTEEEQAKVDAYKAEAASLDRTIDAAISVGAMDARLDEPEAPAASRVPRMAAPVADPAPQGNESGFKSLGEFLSVVRFNPRDDRLQALQQMDENTAGGYNVPREFLGTLLKVEPGEALVRPRATVIPAGESPDAGVDIPALDQGEASNIYGGVEVEWIAEGAEKPETAVAFKQVQVTPKEVAATLPVTDKLLRNWAAAGMLFETLLRGALVAAEDRAFIRGDGSGKPTGFLHALNTGAIRVARAAANAISYQDVLRMEESAMGSNLVYILSRTARTAVSQLKDEAGQYIWRRAAEGMPPTLNGIPAIMHDSMSKLGTLGDIVLVDLGYYLIKDGFGISVSASEHAEFRKNRTLIKAFTNVDGKAWLTSPLTTEGGDKVSPFVFLDVPAG